MASTVEKTFSFRAPEDLARRVTEARARLEDLSAAEPDVQEWIGRELEMAFARQLRRAPEMARDQSAFLRAAAELVIGVTEKVAAGLEAAPAYAAAEADDTDRTDFGRAALKSAEALWR